MLQIILGETLDSFDITMNKLATESDLRPNTVHDFARGNSKRIDLVTLDKMLIGLNKIASNRQVNKMFDLTDVIKFRIE